MIVSYLKLKNWRNFRQVAVPLTPRVFLAGPNACGKSNFLDVFRFLRDIAKAGGGLQQAVKDRGGLSKIRCLAARKEPDVEIEIHLSNGAEENPIWKYAIGIKQQPRGSRLPYLVYERIWDETGQILDRPDGNDAKDDLRLTQTHLEQISANEKFRSVAKFLDSILYLHLVPHLEAIYEHWRPQGAKQREDQFSDGTLRLISLLWSLLEGESLLLLEEPELSLNAAIVRTIAPIIHRLQKKKGRQVMVSTHSADLLRDKGIGGEEILVMTPTSEGTVVEVASSIREVRDLLEGGFSVAEAVMPRAEPKTYQQGWLFNV